jgi:long-chain fatty acid transport protein
VLFRSISAFTPQQLVLGLSANRWRPWTLMLDITWLNWAAYDSPTAAIAADLDVDVPPGLPIQVPASPAPSVMIPPYFRNTLTFRAGVEYAALRFGDERVVFGRREALVSLPLRVGYAFEPSPIPPQHGATSFLDSDRHSISGGFGVALSAPFDAVPGQLHIDVYGAWSRLVTRSQRKDNPADFTGDYSAGGNIYSAGAGMRLVL